MEPDCWELGDAPGVYHHHPVTPIISAHLVILFLPGSLLGLSSGFSGPRAECSQPTGGRQGLDQRHSSARFWRRGWAPPLCTPCSPLTAFTRRVTLAISVGRRPSTPRRCVGTRAVVACGGSSAGRACGIATGRT